MFHSFFHIYLYIFFYISIYISIYILKKERNVLTFFCKRTKHSQILLHSLQKSIVFFSVLYKRTLPSLRSFPFFRKERKRTKCTFGSHTVSRQKLEKRTEKNGMFFKRTGKNGTFWIEKDAVPNPAFYTALIRRILLFNSYNRSCKTIFIGSCNPINCLWSAINLKNKFIYLMVSCSRFPVARSVFLQLFIICNWCDNTVLYVLHYVLFFQVPICQKCSYSYLWSVIDVTICSSLCFFLFQVPSCQECSYSCL